MLSKSFSTFFLEFFNLFEENLKISSAADTLLYIVRHALKILFDHVLQFCYKL